MKIFVDEMELIGSPTVIVPPNKTAKVILDDSPPNLTFEFTYASKDDGKTMSLDYISKGPHCLHIVFNNFGKTLGTFQSGFIALGTYKSKKLSFNYHTAHLSDEMGYKLDLFFFLSEEAKK